MHMIECHLEYVSLRVGLQCGDLVLGNLKLEEELDVLGDVELVADVERSRLHLYGLFHMTLRSFSAKKEKNLQPTRRFPCWIFSCLAATCFPFSALKMRAESLFFCLR